MRGLLDITDNLDQDGVVHPDRVRVLDGDDTYLVVAADKGTATFSDTANGVAAEYGYWLGDAFASGGSAGFDHKALAITARGAWESVKRHFRELGIDIMSTPFTVVGIGDMSGDVFGNGMLLSPFIKLVAAFDHRHVFVDPDPDPIVSFEERQRLFDLPGSSWNDYDRTKMSPAGDIFDRKAKSVTPSAAGARRARHPRRRARGHDAERPDQGHPEGARRPAVERRHRHLREVDARSRTPTSATVRTTPCGSTATRRARPGRRRRRQPRMHAARADRVRARRRPDQHRLHRQLRRRRHLRPRGELKILLGLAIRGASSRWSSATSSWRRAR